MVLALAMAKEGGLRRRRETCDGAALSDETVARLQIWARQRGVQLRHEPGPVPPPLFEADSALLQHALENLISNAIKFTPRGGRSSFAWPPNPMSWFFP